jgi:hypothetical protein
VLFHLPNLVARIGPIHSLLDFGCGPTIHVAVCFRQSAEHIFLADYLPQNREELARWLEGKSNFDWTSVLRVSFFRHSLLWVFNIKRHIFTDNCRPRSNSLGRTRPNGATNKRKNSFNFLL